MRACVRVRERACVRVRVSLRACALEAAASARRLRSSDTPFCAVALSRSPVRVRVRRATAVLRPPAAVACAATVRAAEARAARDRRALPALVRRARRAAQRTALDCARLAHSRDRRGAPLAPAAAVPPADGRSCAPPLPLQWGAFAVLVAATALAYAAEEPPLTVAVSRRHRRIALRYNGGVRPTFVAERRGRQRQVGAARGACAGARNG